LAPRSNAAPQGDASRRVHCRESRLLNIYKRYRSRKSFTLRAFRSSLCTSTAGARDGTRGINQISVWTNSREYRKWNMVRRK